MEANFAYTIAAYFTLWIGAPATITAAMAYFVFRIARESISEKIKASVKADYDQKLETLKAELKASADAALEKQRHALTIEATIHDIRYSKLHEKRMLVITDVYAKMAAAFEALRDYTKAFEPAGGPTRPERAETFRLAVLDLVEVFRPGKIFLPKASAERVEAMLQEVNRTGAEFFFGVDAMVRVDTAKWQEIVRRVDGDLRRLLVELEQEFRTAMGDAE